MKLKIVPVLTGLLIFSQTLIGQETSASPYSALGIGDILFSEQTEQAAMGGLSMVPLNPYYASSNFSNPAANRDLKITSFDVSVNHRTGQFKNGTKSSTLSSTYVSNLSLAFPVGNRARAGFGFRPYSTVGYELATITTTDQVTYQDKFKGSGGLNSVHAFGSYNINENFSVGLRLNYLFGDIEKVETISTEGLALHTDYTTRNDVKGFQLSMGGLYTKRLEDKKRIDVGLNYTIGSKLHTRTEDMTTTYSLVGLEPANIDTVRYSQISGKIKIPQSLSVAASYRKDMKWMAGVQLEWGDWKNFSIQPEPSLSADLGSRLRISAGGFWIPNFNSYKSYFDRVVYRAGLFYETTPLKVANETVNKFGLTAGFGFPIGKDRDASMLNIGVEVGSLGNAKSLPLKENYFNARIGLTINDIWFRKKVID